MMINRSEAPTIQPVKKLKLTPPKLIFEKGEFKFYYLQDKAFEGFKLDLYFDAGYKHNSRLKSKIASESLFLGTPKLNEERIEDIFDLYGSFKGAEVSADYSMVSFLGANSNFQQIINHGMQAISENQLTSKSFEQLINAEKQKYKIKEEKVATRARNLFLNKLYQPLNLSDVTMLEDFDKLSLTEIQSFIDLHYKNGLTKITLTGNVPENQLNQVIETISPIIREQRRIVNIEYKFNAGKYYQPKDGAVQTAIRVGRLLFNRNHQDYPEFMFMNTLFGGYFGSRLMSSLREDKGLTYGVGSGVAQANDHGYFFISTEVNKESYEMALDLIKSEIEKLQNEPVSMTEIETVKSYLVGSLLKNSDGSFAQMSKFISVEEMGLDLSYYDRLLLTYHQITPEKIQEMARKYLSWTDLLICSAG